MIMPAEASSEGDPSQGFVKEIYSYRQDLVNVAYRILYDIEAARDIVQDSYIAAIEWTGTFSGKSSPKTWLYRIVINKSIDARRRSQRRLGLLERYFREEVSYGHRNPADSADDRDLLRRMLDKMPDAQRIPLLLCDVDGLSYEEIADTLQISLNTVRTRIFRCREKLRKEFQKSGSSL